MTDSWESWLKPETITALAAVVALLGVVAEYRRNKRKERLERAQRLLDRLDSDDILLFAVTLLDWGAGMVAVPAAWRGVVGHAAIVPDPSKLLSAMTPELSEQTASDPCEVLYRHAFVRLFNHLETIEDLRRAGAIHVENLQPIVWLARELHRWQYAPEPEWPFGAAMNKWYEPGKLTGLITSILAKYGDKPTGFTLKAGADGSVSPQSDYRPN
jgi:hypothetical protein